MKQPFKAKKKSHEAESDAKAPWTSQDWALFVDAWELAVDEFVELGNEPDEKVKLPNWLIRQKFVTLGGLADTTVGSITAKKRCIIHSYRFICQCVAALEKVDGSDWFDLSTTERFRLQRKLVGPKSSQRVGCEIDRQTYLKIGAIIDKEQVLRMVTGAGRKRKRQSRKLSSSEEESEGLESESDDKVSQESDAHVDDHVVETLLEAQNARFEQLLRELQDERRKERKQNQAMLLEILHQRAPEPLQNVSYIESLVRKQQEQLMDLFAQMRKERQHEREDFHALLRQLCLRKNL